MDLQNLQRNWDSLGQADPLWAILAYPQMHGNKWSPQEFFATGEEWLAGYLAKVERLGLLPQRRERAMDFGCGAGRLTRALAGRFAHADGVDVAPSMIELARGFHTDDPRVSFHLNDRADLRLFADDSFDAIVSIIVLQHLPPELTAGYLREFVRVLRPGGVALFTVPDSLDRSPAGLARRLPNRLQNVYRRRRYGYAAVMELHTVPRGRVEAEVRAAGGVVAAVLPDESTGPPFRSYLYVVTKPERQPDADA